MAKRGRKVGKKYPRKPPPETKGPRGGKRAGAGRQPHEPTPQLQKKVKQHASLGVTHEDIARLMGISKPTLEKHYRPQLDTAILELNTAVIGKLASAATSREHTGPTITAAIFWAKTRLGWKETVVQQHTGHNDGPVEFEHTFTLNIFEGGRSLKPEE
jgi:hypothetical protein